MTLKQCAKNGQSANEYDDPNIEKKTIGIAQLQQSTQAKTCEPVM